MKRAAAASPTRRLPLTRCPMNAVAKIVTVLATIASAIPTATATSLSIQPTTRNGTSAKLRRSGQPTAPAGACPSMFVITAARRHEASAAAPAITQ